MIRRFMKFKSMIIFYVSVLPIFCIKTEDYGKKVALFYKLRQSAEVSLIEGKLRSPFGTFFSVEQFLLLTEEAHKNLQKNIVHCVTNNKKEEKDCIQNAYKNLVTSVYQQFEAEFSDCCGKGLIISVSPREETVLSNLQDNLCAEKAVLRYLLNQGREDYNFIS